MSDIDTTYFFPKIINGFYKDNNELFIEYKYQNSAKNSYCFNQNFYELIN